MHADEEVVPGRRRFGSCRRTLALFLLGLLGVLLPRSALAEAPLEVRLDLEQCPELSRSDVRRAFAAELGARLAESPGPGVTEAVVICKNGNALLRVRDPLSRKTAARRIDLSRAAPAARARLVAIATAELVLASWSELATNPEPRVKPAGPAPPPAARQAARERVLAHWSGAPAPPSAPVDFTPRPPPAKPLRFVAVVSRRAFFSHPGALWGAGLRVGQDRFASVAWAVDAVFDRGSVSSNIGAYEIETWTIGANLFFYHRWGWFTARVGAGLRAGLARSTELVQTQFGGTSALTPWGWPMGVLSLTVRPAKQFVIEAAGETSYVSLPVTGDNLEGVWFDVELGLGVEL